MEIAGAMGRRQKNLWECMQQKFAISLHVNFCFLHAQMSIKTETNFLIDEFYINSVTKTVRWMLDEFHDFAGAGDLKWFEDFQSKCSMAQIC